MMRKLTNYMLKHEISYTVTTNEDGDDYHLELQIFNEYYEVRTNDEAKALLKYLKECCSMRGFRKQVRELKRLAKQLEKEATE